MPSRLVGISGPLEGPLATGVAIALQVTPYLYPIFFAISNNRWNYRDLTHAKEVIGFEPQDSAYDFPFCHSRIASDRTSSEVVNEYRGR